MFIFVRVVETSTEVLRATHHRATLVGFVANWTVTTASSSGSQVQHKVCKRTKSSTQVSRSIFHGMAQLWLEQGARRRYMWHRRQWFIRVSLRLRVQRMRWPSWLLEIGSRDSELLSNVDRVVLRMDYFFGRIINLNYTQGQKMKVTVVDSGMVINGYFIKGITPSFIAWVSRLTAMVGKQAPCNHSRKE